jgi:hypothetical protein
MHNVQLATPPLTYVSWGCRRCGFKGGIANTTFPIDPHWTEELGRTLFTTLRLKLVRVHQAKHGCVASSDDFVLGRHVPEGKTIVGVV